MPGHHGICLQGYSSSAQTAAAADGLRWVADYFVKCHHSDVAYTAQVLSTKTSSPSRYGAGLQKKALAFVTLLCHAEIHVFADISRLQEQSECPCVIWRASRHTPSSQQPFKMLEVRSSQMLPQRRWGPAAT